MKTPRYGRLLLGIILLAQHHAAKAVPDLWIREDSADTGAEPNTSSAYLYLSDDIWVRNTADPNYNPTPFPSGSPTWTPLPHQNPCYRDCKTSAPNYIYVRIRNRGTTASTGTETLHVYWAKASTGLNWSSDWKDHIASPCGTSRLYGQEITKPRKNGATATAGEKAAYVAAVQAIDTASFQFPDAVTYFDKQNIVHLEVTSVGAGGTGLQVAHSNIRFLSWHREMIARYECLLQETNPLVNLLYWDWTTDPTGTIAGAGGYMGASSGTVGAPFTGWGITRLFGPKSGCPATGAGVLSVATQTTNMALTAFASFRSNTEQPHNCSHVFIGGTTMGTATGARDPLFFFIHANVDRLWAKWQRSQLSRWVPATAFDASQADANLTANLEPFAGGAGITPWTLAGGYMISKPSTAHSIVSPPTYDDTPLTIPVIGAGQCCIIGIPFYPPRLTECGSFSDPAHLCLLARIETSPTAPFGMTSPETSALWSNVANNNNIAWKNTTLDDCNVGPFIGLSAPIRLGTINEIVRAVNRTGNSPVRLRFAQTLTAAGGEPIATYGDVLIKFDEKLMDAWVAGGAKSTGAQMRFDGYFGVEGPEGATFDNILLPRDVWGRYDLILDPHPNYQDPRGAVFNYDVVQYEPNAAGGMTPVGGQRHLLDLNKMVLSRKGEEWLVQEDPLNDPWPPQTVPKWRKGNAPFATDPLEGETKLVIPAEKNGAYFVRQFMAGNTAQVRNLQLALRADDGVAVYLNGTRIYSDNLEGQQALSGRDHMQARGIRTVMLPEAVPHLKSGLNTLAVEIHRFPRGEASMELELAVNVSPVVMPPPQAEVVIDRAVYQVGETIRAVLDRLVVPGQTFTLQLDGDNPQPVPFREFAFQNPGTHQVVGIVTNPDGTEQRSLAAFQVVENLKPVIRVNVGRMPDGHLHVMTTASDPPDGQVTEVSFYLRQHGIFGTPAILLGKLFAPPFDFVMPPIPEPGEYMLFAEATDNKGLVGESIPAHIVVPRVPGNDSLVLHPNPGATTQSFILEWDLPGSTLQEWMPPNDWMDVRGAVSPQIIDMTTSRGLFRVVSPNQIEFHNHETP